MFRSLAALAEQVHQGSQCSAPTLALLCSVRAEYTVFGAGAQNTSAVMEVLNTEGQLEQVGNYEKGKYSTQCTKYKV